MRVLIIADTAFAAEAIRRELRHASGCHVLGYVDGRKPCALPISSARPDIVLVDDTGEPDAVLANVRDARAAAADAKLILLTQRMNREWLAQASGAGIDAAIAKSARPAALGLLVREVAADHVFNAIAPAAPSGEASSNGSGALTARELEILRLVAAGGSNSSIASRLWVAEQTVKFHLSNIYRKLGVANRTEASHYAHVNGLLEPWPPEPAAIERAA